MLAPRVSPMPMAVMSAASRVWPKISPQTRISPAAPTMIHLRSKRSPRKKPISGPTGSAPPIIVVHPSLTATAPALDPEGRRRHEHIGEKGGDRHADEADRLIDREGAAAKALRREFAQIGANGDDLDAEPDAANEPPEVEAEGVALQRHHDVRR